jgi:hypothetical protein
VLSAGDRAYGAWCRAGQYASNKKTDGFVSHRAAKQINSDVRVWKRLVEVGLMESAEGGYVIHDYLDYNPSKAELEAKSEARRAAGALGSEARWGKNSERIAIERHQLCDRTDPTLRSKGTNSAIEPTLLCDRKAPTLRADSEQVRENIGGEDGNRYGGCQATPDTPVPSRPDPLHTDQIPPVVPPRGTREQEPDFDLTPPDPDPPKSKRPRTIKTVLPTDWAPSAAHHQQAMTEGGKPASWVESEAMRMRDWASSKGERCADWDARFRNWIRRALDDGRGPRPNGPSGGGYRTKIQPPTGVTFRTLDVDDL